MISIIKRKCRFIPVSGLIILAIVVFPPLWIVTTNVYGTSQTITVSFHKKMRQKGLLRSDYPIVSCGYYYVKGKQHTAFTTEKVPIGTKFEIKYNPIIPSDYNVIKIIQE